MTDTPPAFDCACHPTGENASDSRRDNFVLRASIATVIAGQSMVFGLGYNNALIAGEAPPFGSPFYIGIHTAFILSTLIVIALLGKPLLIESSKAIRARKITVEALFSLSLLGAFGGSLISTFTGASSVYYELVGILLVVYGIGKRLGYVQRNKAFAATQAVRESFQWAWTFNPHDNQRIRRHIADLRQGDQVSIFPGEPVTVDGTVLTGSGFVRETALSGEPMPVRRQPGQTLRAGSWSIDAEWTIQVTHAASDRHLDRILAAVEQTRHAPSRLQKQADHLMQFFVPVVALTSALTLLVWLLIGAVWWQALFNAMAVLLVACPCALGIALPIGIWSGLTQLSRIGLASRSGRLLDTLAEADLFLFDKTGTLTESELSLKEFLPTPAWQPRAKWLLSAIASIETRHPHPVARTLASSAPAHLPVQDIRIIPGRGVSGSVEGHYIEILADTYPFWSVRADGSPAATIQLQESLRADTAAVFADLQQLGIEIRILTGDPQPLWKDIAGIHIQTGLSPEDKAEEVRACIRKGRKFLFIGDGINDAPALAAAPTSIAMGSAANLTQATADGILAGDTLVSLSRGVRLARKLQRELAGNFRFAIFYNIIGMSLAALGILHPVIAALLMVGSSALVSWRAQKGVTRQ